MFGWTLFISWVAVTTLSAARTAAHFRSNVLDSEWAESFFASTFAAVPGAALLAEFAGRALVAWLFEWRSAPVYEYAGTILGLLWALVGPALLIFALLRQIGAIPPRSVLLTQLGHLLTWGSSTLMALWFASSV